MSATMRIAIVGDIHDYSLAIWPWELLGKPLAGQTNLWLNRRKRFDRSLIAPTVQKVRQSNPDLVLFSGDVTTTSRPREFRSIAKHLSPLIESHECVMVAGNHDRYTFAAQRTRRFERFFPGCAPGVLPFVKPLIGGWKLIAVDSAVPRLFDSKGSIGNRQLQHVRTLLSAVGQDEGVIVLVHYPFGKPPQLPPMKEGHRLIDEREWRDAIAHCRGRVIIVHGHVHCPWLWKPQMQHVETHAPLRIIDINVGSPTMHLGAWPRGQGFWTLDLPSNPTNAISLSHHVMGDGEAPVGFESDVVSRESEREDRSWMTRVVRLTLG